MKKDAKCDRCNEAEATVYFSVVSGKGKTTRKRYCKTCAAAERIRLASQVMQSTQVQKPTSIFGMVKQEMEKSSNEVPEADETPAGKIKRLDKAMALAVSKEDYKKAAVIRDQIAAIKKEQKS